MKPEQILKSYANGTSTWEELIAAIKALPNVQPGDRWNESWDIEGTVYELTEEAHLMGFTPEEYGMLIEIIKEARSDSG